MSYGYHGKILRVDLTTGSISIEKRGEAFYRKYMGGSCLGAYYLTREIEAGIDALTPENILVLATSPTTGAPISGASRFNVTAKSPLTGTIGDSQGGGFWGPELKRAGFDAIVVIGRAQSPVYLFVHDGKTEIRDASHLWGMVTGEAQQRIRAELGDERLCMALIGPGGENLVRFANITNNLKHFCGRNGMGAVMGAKNLKAVAVRGHHPPTFHNERAIRDLARRGAKRIEHNDDMLELRDLGTAGTITYQQEVGGLPTRNYKTGVFDGAHLISGDAIRDTMLVRNEGCYACAVRCKRVVRAMKPYEVDPRYGGPEYESLAALGSYLSIDDLVTIAKANELCNKYTLDTISLGGTLAFAMECFERGIIDSRDTDGIDLRFGNAGALIPMIHKIANREGIGDLLAEGCSRAARVLGKDAEMYAMHVKGQELPAHMPQVKASLALAYATCPFGADHQSSEHDPMIGDEPLREGILTLGLLDSAPIAELSFEKAKLWAYTQLAFSALDTLDLCQFCFGAWTLYSFNEMIELLNNATGWDTSLWELMKVGERRINLMRAFNAREGFTRASDCLPERIFEPLASGPTQGQRIDRDTFVEMLDEYYSLMGWDVATGNPTRTKLLELGLGWV